MNITPFDEHFIVYGWDNYPVNYGRPKEEKAALKAKSEAEVMQAYKDAGLSDTQIAACKDVVATSNQKSNELKKQTTLTDDEKATAKKIISDEKNAKMKEIMGEDGYRKYNATRKSQKANATTPQ